MKLNKITFAVAITCFSISSFGQAVTGTSLSITNTTGFGASMSSSTGGNTGQLFDNATMVGMTANTMSGGNYTNNSWVETSSSLVNIGSSNNIQIYSGAINPSTGNIVGTSQIALTPDYARMLAAGSSAYSGVGWSATGTPGTFTNNIIVNSSGTSIASATDISLTATTNTLTATTNNIVGETNINTTGVANTSIGNSGAGTVTLTSGTNSLLVNNSGTTITGAAEITGNTTVGGTLGVTGVTTTSGITNTGNIATTTLSTSGAATLNSATITNNASVGGTLVVTGVTTTNGILNTGTLSSSGNATIGSASASTVTLGSASGNSTISMNGNRIQNVAAGTSGTDAVNMNQLNSVNNSVASLNNQYNNLNNQLQQSQTQYRSGIAGVAAMNGIGALNSNQKVNFGIGVGGFAGQAGIAAGGNVRITENMTFKASVAQASNNTAVSGGLTIGF